MEQIPFTIVASVIDKQELKETNSKLSNPYHLALGFCLEKSMMFFREEEQRDSRTFVIVEERGKEENRQLQSVFQAAVDGENALGVRMPMSIRFANKQTNVIGLQVADLVAYPIGRHLMNPDQNNRSYEILKKKLWKWPNEESAIKIYPEKRKTSVTTEVQTPTGHSQSPILHAWRSACMQDGWGRGLPFPRSESFYARRLIFTNSLKSLRPSSSQSRLTLWGVVNQDSSQLLLSIEFQALFFCKMQHHNSG